MWRSLFMALGIFMVVLGVQFLTIEKIVMADSSKRANSSQMTTASSLNTSLKSRDFKPPEGLPWILLSAGAVTIIYTFTIPKRVAAQTHPS